MGKKKNQTVRAKRIKAAAEALEEQQAERIVSKTVESKPNQELFVIDTDAASNHALSFIPKEDRTSRKKKFDKQHVSDVSKVKRLIDTLGKDGVEKLAKEGAAAATKRRTRMRRTAGTARTNFDLWGGGGDAASGGGNNGKKKRNILPVMTGQSSAAGTAPMTLLATDDAANAITNDPQEQIAHNIDKDAIHPSKVQLSNKVVKIRTLTKSLSKPTVPIELAHGGQSYNPDENQHQDVIGEALSIELKREEALAYRKTPISNGLSKETLAIMVHSSDEEDSDSDDDSDDEEKNNDSFQPRPKSKVINRENKKTRVQRNKQKRTREEHASIQQRKKQKTFLHEVNEAKLRAKEIKQEERLQKERAEYLKRVQEEKRKEPLGLNFLHKLSDVDPIHVPSLPVALTSELGRKEKDDDDDENETVPTATTSLRKVRPKGSLLTDRSQSMISRNMVNPKRGANKFIVQGKKRTMKGGKGREYLLI